MRKMMEESNIYTKLDKVEKTTSEMLALVKREQCRRGWVSKVLHIAYFILTPIFFYTCLSEHHKMTNTQDQIVEFLTGFHVFQLAEEEPD